MLMTKILVRPLALPLILLLQDLARYIKPVPEISSYYERQCLDIKHLIQRYWESCPAVFVSI
jgi:hypothetical protein